MKKNMKNISPTCKQFPPAEAAKPERLSVCAGAHKLIEKGEYQAAAEALGELWPGVGGKPDLTGYEPFDQAEILLAVGTLTTRLGNASQTKEAQEKAKNLLSESLVLFAQMGELDRQAWAQSEMGFCYSRIGEYEEARMVFKDALQLTSHISGFTECKLVQSLAIVEILTHNYRLAEELLSNVEYLAVSLPDDTLRGNFYFHRALALRRIAEEESLPTYLTRALADYQEALAFYERAQYLSSCAAIHNNIAFVLSRLGQHQEAHEQVDKALEIHKSMDNQSSIASAYDTKAQIYLAEGRLAEAEKAAFASAQLLHGGDEYSLLAGSLVTLGLAYARRGAWKRARRAFEDAYLTANHVGDKGGAGDALLAWLEELGDEMLPEGFMEVYRRAEELLKDSPRTTVQKRLREVSQRKMQEAGPAFFSFAPAAETEKAFKKPERMSWVGFSLSRAVKELEEYYITQALKESDGMVSRAAQLLGLTHQNLSTQLQNRHSNLLNARRPQRKRRSDKLPDKE
jgi:tetratricopeptide (TPR) repeat protein